MSDAPNLLSAPSVTVKPLEWRDYDNPVFAGPDVAIADVQFNHRYHVQRDPWAATFMALLHPRLPITSSTLWWESKGHETLEAAKAAAQADYETRIMAAIQTNLRLATPTAQCCMCGKTGLSTAEDGGPECELHDGRWVCSRECYEHSLGWQPISTAPHDEDVLVWYDHDADPYQDPDNPERLTPYATWAESGEYQPGKGVCVAQHQPPYLVDEGEDSSTLPAAWFVREVGYYERVVNPLFWKPLDAPPSEGGGALDAIRRAA